MRYRLGLDLGTASIGLVAFELDEDDTPLGVTYHSVRIFDEPLTPPKKGGVGEPKKAIRRLKRQQRRLQTRRVRRLRKLAHLAPLLGLDPTAIPADHGQSIHRLRALAAHQAIALPELFQVLLKLAKRRGYAGGFRERGDDEESGVVKAGIGKLQSDMEAHGCETLGDYLQWRFAQGQTLKLKGAGLYADRQMVLEEFERIWAIQTQHHPVLHSGGDELRETFRAAIFFQRPLRSPAPMVGNCPLEPSLRRAPMAQPATQRFRIEKQIADLRWSHGRRQHPLDTRQQQVIRELLCVHAEVSFEYIYRELDARGCPRPPLYWLNLESSSRDKLVGDKTRAAMERLGLLAPWSALTPGQQITVINLLADIGSPELLREPDWPRHLTAGSGNRVRSRQFDPEVVAFLNQLAVHPRFGRLAAIGLESGRSAYSLKALNKLASAMTEYGCDEHSATALVYPPDSQCQTGLATSLEVPRTTGNVVVDVALRQIRREVNNAVRHLGGPPAQIIVELSRDMALGVTRRAEIISRIDKNTRMRRQAAKAISDSGATATTSAIRRYLLWTEQDQSWCPYCTQPINLSDALDGGVTHYEHIYPRSLTRIGKQRDFLVLAHRECNDAKSDRTPWQAWGQGQDPARWQVVQERAARLRSKRLYGKARQLLAEETADTTIDEQVIQDFSARQFHESSWIAKLAAGWLRTICPDVMVGRGTLTAHLRRAWGLETVIPEVRLDEGLRLLDTDGQVIDSDAFGRYRNHWEGHPAAERTDRMPDKRIDHRHHLIDALVIGLCDRSLYQRMARHYKKVTEAGETRMRWFKEPPLHQIRPLALSLIRDCNLTHKPDRHLGGNLFQESAYGRSKDGQRLLKRKLVETLGGGPKATVTALLKDIEQIEHASTREVIRQAINQRLADGKTPAEAIKLPIWHPTYGNYIRRVVLQANGNAGAFAVNHGRRQSGLSKFLIPEGYAFLEVSPQSLGLPQVELVPLHLAFRRAKEPGVKRFYKGDMVRDTQDGHIYIVGQIITNGPSLILARHVETISVNLLIGTKGRKKVSGRQIVRLEVIEDV